jgi:acetyl esterase
VPVAAEIQPLLDQLRGAEVDPADLTPELLRAGLDGLWMAWTADTAAPVDVVERTVPGGDGPVAARVYRRASLDAPAPVVVYLHGGGFVVGSLDSHDTTCRQLADRSGATVVAVDYRLAPEHPYPAGADDCMAALRWAASAQATDELQGDGRLVVAGDSAGGNLAAVSALRARDEGGPDLALQVLVYPCLDPSCSTRSHERNASGYLLTTATMRWFWEHYLRGAPDGAASSPYVDPRRAASHADLPPALVATAEYDPLVDEGDEYAQLLAGAGVPVEHVRYDGMVHGFASMFAVTPQAFDVTGRIAAAIRAC